MLALTASPDEDWRDIPGFPRYQASSLGRIRSIASGEWRILRATPHPKTGYVAVSPRVDGKYITRSVHRLIAAAFLGDADGRDVNHINGNKHDNRLANLEYLSRGDNHRHAYRSGLRNPVGMKLGPAQRRAILAMDETASRSAIARQFGVSRSTIDHVHTRRRHLSTSVPFRDIGV